MCDNCTRLSAMLTNECCPQCGVEADSGRVRLVQDSCGHRKCRECLLNDEAGCKLCSHYTPEYTELRQAENVPQDTDLDPPALTPLTNSTEIVHVNDPSAPGASTSFVDLRTVKSREDCHSPVLSENIDNEDGACDIKESDVEKTEGRCGTSDSINKKTISKKPGTFGLKEHIVFTPGNPPKYKCLRCGKSYNNRKAARYHNYCGALHTEKPHTCSECGQGFVTTGHLSYHMKSHTGSLPFTCKNCGKGFKQVSKLNRHLKSHEGGAEKLFKCEMCEKAFSTNQILKEHMLTHSGDNFVSCPVCSKKLSSRSCLRKHKKLHAEPIHKCKDCGKKFPVKGNLEAHMKTHQRERKFKCRECPRAFKIQSDLRRHVLVHQDDGEWECTHCNLIFRRRDNLVRHLKNIHPEFPLIVSSKQKEKELKESKEESARKEETSTEARPVVSRAVSVIRAVPVIQKTDAVLPSYSQDDGSSGILVHKNTHYNAQDEGGACTTTAAADSMATSSFQDQNFQRESVVHFGSSSAESTCYSNNAMKTNCEPPHTADQNFGGRVECVIQNNAVPRPMVIVAKKTAL